MAVIRKKSVLPLYLAGAVWLIAAYVAPMYRVSAILLTAGVSILAYLVGAKLIPGEEIHIPDPPVSTGDTEVDELLKLGDGALAQMRTLNQAIADAAITAQIDELEALTGKIIQEVAKHPEKKGQIRRFMDYFLPTTLKILGVYDRVDDVQGENAQKAKTQIEGMMETIVVAFRNQYDALFQDVSVDISADIRVMEQLMQQEGLAEKQENQPFGRQ